MEESDSIGKLNENPISSLRTDKTRLLINYSENGSDSEDPFGQDIDETDQEEIKKGIGPSKQQKDGGDDSDEDFTGYIEDYYNNDQYEENKSIMRASVKYRSQFQRERGRSKRLNYEAILEAYEDENQRKLREEKEKSNNWEILKDFFAKLYQVLLCSIIVIGTLIYPSVPGSIIVLLCIIYLSLMVGTSLKTQKKKRLIAILLLLSSLTIIIAKIVLVILLYTGKFYKYDRTLWVSFGITINVFQIDLKRGMETFGPESISMVVAGYLFIYVRGKIRKMVNSHENLRIVDDDRIGRRGGNRRFKTGPKNYKIWVVMMIIVMMFTSMIVPSFYSLSLTVFT